MKAILRSAIVAAGLATALATSVLPANAAPGAGEFQGWATISCFGCGGTQPGTAELAVNGVNTANGVGAGAVVVGGVLTDQNGTGNVHAVYNVVEGTGTDCVIQGSATGNTTGAVAVAFTWTRLGAVAVITTTGDFNPGVGVAAFVVTTVGLPCGTNNLKALVVGALAGA